MGALVTREKGVVAVEAAPDQQQYLTFMLGGELFAIGILTIKEIIEYGNLTTVPLMPDFIRGVINLRGSVVPVVDLSARFGRKSAEITRRTCIVIIEVEAGEDKQDIGVMVDAVNEVLEIPDNQIEPAPAFGAKIRTDFIAGMGKVNGKFVILLNVDKVLSVDELAILDGVSGA
ncbi:MAG: purine-binding chemotaxis protein CheW [Nitrosomonadales bacterium]|nr:purine-binding chemotaxis protein CheW [Nitrosomonadales bacterium]